MKRTWTIIGVADVAGSFRWYQTLFGQPATEPAHDFFGQLTDDDGTVLLCLHRWGDHEHPSLASPDTAEPGNGLLLFFRVDDFDAALLRARALVTALEQEPGVNPSTATREFVLRDPDGYYVMISEVYAVVVVVFQSWAHTHWHLYHEYTLYICREPREPCFPSKPK